VVRVLREHLAAASPTLSLKEQQWLDRIEKELGNLPASGDDLRSEMLERYGNLFDPASYGWG
jgi:hypothetical protein